MGSEGYHFKTLGVEAIEDVMEFIREFFNDREPLSVMLDLCPFGYRIPAQQQEYEGYLKKNLSLGIFNSNEELIGITIVNGSIKDDNKEEYECVLNNNKCQCSASPEKFKILNKFLYDLETNYGNEKDIYKLLKAHKIMEVLILGIKPSYGHKGLGTMLMRECEKNAQKMGFEILKCVGTSLFTQKICSKEGFKSLYRIKYENYEMNGKKVFKKDCGVHKDAVMFYKRL
ncbi:unnamed protein product [Lepeophtheirus salmonis]|uniref:(salmon louse) hypothetical protein n=2 Tax=Lepeophtheirus salmonis TaxID=72036 RepID=A0A7R8H5R6_LEPSM|nr:unnamed protein product [Lepeophtheirus salmonis]CAF2888330.1 unnamed protein product [Lepeophtheirus salmonis]